MRSKTKRIIHDKDGRLVLLQTPNTLLWVWIVIKIVTLILNEGQIRTGFEQLGTAVLFTWAVYELTHGVNYLRKFLGLIIMAIIITGYFGLSR